MRKLLSVLLLVMTFSWSYAQRGIHGAKTIVGTEIVNEYTSLTANATIGSTSITVAANTLNGNGRFAGNLAGGDLIMIVQMQGASVNVSTHPTIPTTTAQQDTTHGRVTNYNNCGNWEVVQVSSVSGSNTINLDCALQNNYTANGRVQVVRIPRYTSLTVPNSTTLTCDPWSGTIGGILAVEVINNTTVNGTIDAEGVGFRGGNPDNSTRNGAGFASSTDATEGAEKGESIGGNTTDYTAFSARYCRGSIANGGGGGNAHNSGGGGGANAGNPALWTSNGNPDPFYNSAWALEVPSIAGTTSSGGGRGGYTFSQNDRNPNAEGGNPPFGPFPYPNWGGDNRRQVGGWGGRPLLYSTGRIFFGGGGGSGEGNLESGANWSSRGGHGGGIVLLQNYGTVSGSGTINANGEIGQTAGNGGSSGIFLPAHGIDGAGGGGGGGVVLAQSIGAVSGVTISADGGRGGNQWITGGTSGSRDQAEGPGGGGGGGYVAVSNGAPTRTATGGVNGVTNSVDMRWPQPNPTDSFPPNGATSGGDGINNANINAWEVVAANDTICTGQSTTLNASINGTTPGGTNLFWNDSPFAGTQLGAGASYNTPVLTQTDTFYVGTCPGTYRQMVIVVVQQAPTANAGNDTTICSGHSASLNASGGTTYTWDADPDLSTTTGPNPLASPTVTKYFYVTVGNAAGCTARDSVLVTVINCPTPVANWSSTDSTLCTGDCINFTDLSTNTPTSWTWYFPGGTPATSTAQNPTNICYNTAGNYPVTLVARNAFGQDSVVMTNFISVVNCPPPVAAFMASDSSICEGQCINFTDLSTNSPTSWTWYFPGSNTPTSTAQNPSAICYPNAGTYLVALVATNANGTDSLAMTAFITVVSCPNPIAAFSASDSTLCEGQCINFTDLSSSTPTGWNWTFTGATPASSTAQNPTNICYAAAGTYPVKLVVSNANGTDSITYANFITVVACPPPVGGINVTDTVGCEPLCVTYTDGSTNGIQWDWSFPGGTPAASNSQNPGVVCYNTAGTYTTRLIVSNGSGVDTVYQTININTSPTVTTSGTSPINGGDTTSVMANGTPAGGTYTWSPSALVTCSTCPTTGTVALNQDTCFTVIYEAPNSCRDTSTVCITVNDVIHYGVPNAFSPNGDGENDVLFVRGAGIKEMSFFVYNRYGQKVFESFDPALGWNGNHKGKEVNPGVFVYYLDIIFIDNSTASEKGNVTLIR